MIKNSYKSVVVLFAICFVISAALAAVNYITSPVIEQAEKDATQAALKVVMESADSFASVDIAGLPSSVTEAYIARCGEETVGAVLKLSVTGYAKGLTLICGVSSSGKITGIKFISGGETLGKEKTYGESFVGKDVSGASEVDTIAGATLTTKAYKGAVTDALEAYGKVIAKGGADK